MKKNKYLGFVPPSAPFSTSLFPFTAKPLKKNCVYSLFIILIFLHSLEPTLICLFLVITVVCSRSPVTSMWPDPGVNSQSWYWLTYKQLWHQNNFWHKWLFPSFWDTSFLHIMTLLALDDFCLTGHPFPVVFLGSGSALPWVGLPQNYFILYVYLLSR